MEGTLNILLVEDSDNDAILIERELRRGGIAFNLRRVETREAFLLGLEETPDLILSDYRLPTIDSLEALELRGSKCPDVPFIFVSGTIGEDLAIDTLKRGATDYVLKDRISRLIPAVKRALKDVEERVKSQKAQHTLRLLEKAVENTQLGVTITDIRGRIIYTNPAEARMHGYRVQDLVGQDARIFAPRQLWKTLTPDQIKETKNWRRESVNIRQDGTIFPVQIMSDVVSDSSGEPIGIVTICEDISDKHTAEHAFYDQLTNLPTRNLFMDRVGRALKRIKRKSDYRFAVVSLDLDRFKSVNEMLGHSTGDRLIVACARRLEKCLRFGDSVARLGGDEFAVLLEDVREDRDVLFVAERIQQHLILPFDFDGHEIRVTTSMGIACGNAFYDRPDDLLRDANTAMYRAKALGRERAELFDPGMHAGTAVIQPVEIALRRAIERQEFELHYQPIYSLTDSRILGEEALIRWRHPQRGLVHPDDFIPIAEETGLIESIGEWVLRTACLQNCKWQKAGHPQLYVSVNLSARQVRMRNIVSTVQGILTDCKMEPGHLLLEITEQLVLEEVETINQTLKELKDLGVLLAIDDFGTGYSSLSYLKRFYIDVLKIDQSFIRDIVDRPKDEAIARAVITLAHSLNMRVVAEGVETEGQIAFLRTHECDAVQGRYYSAPLTVDEFELVLERAPSGMPAQQLPNHR